MERYERYWPESYNALNLNVFPRRVVRRDSVQLRNWLKARILFMTSSAATLYASEKVG